MPWYFLYLKYMYHNHVYTMQILSKKLVSYVRKDHKYIQEIHYRCTYK